jgi:amidase
MKPWMPTSFLLFLCVLAVLGWPIAAQDHDRASDNEHEFQIEEATIPAMQAALAEGRVSSEELVEIYLARIEAYRGLLNPYITVNRQALAEARKLDEEREDGHLRGPLHGIPLALKDNMLTTQMPTSGGALAFKGFVPSYEATLTAKLRAAGAIILGKTVLTELATWVSDDMPGNYSAVGRYGYNPYDPRPDPRPGVDFFGYPFHDGRPALATGGSSSGIATSANLAAANVGSETSGSILSPSNATMLAGIKPTTGLISRWGVIPITGDQDTAGPMARDVASAAIMLGVMGGPDPHDPATARCPAISNYTPFLRSDGLVGARIGVTREYYNTSTPAQQIVVNDAIMDLRHAGATVEFVSVPSFADLQAWGICANRFQGKGADANCSIVLKYGTKRDFNAFLATLGRRAPVNTLTELREFNLAHQAANAIKYGQARLDISDEMNVAADAARYAADRAKDILLTATHGIDAALAAGHYDALLFPGARGADIAARPGYPSVTVPYGFVPNTPTPPFPDGFNAKPGPFGITFTAKACSEPTLIRLAYAFEQTTKKRVPPFSAPPPGADSESGNKNAR